MGTPARDASLNLPGSGEQDGYAQGEGPLVTGHMKRRNQGISRREGQHVQRHGGTREKTALEEMKRRAAWLEMPAKGRMLRDYFGEEDGSKVFDGAHKS